MVRDRVLDAEPEKPAIGEIDLHFGADPTLRPDGKDVADDQHPDHEFGVDRGPAGMAIVGFKLLVHPLKIEHGVIWRAR